MPLAEVGKFEQSVRSENRIGRNYNKMRKLPVSQHVRKREPGTLRTGFGLFGQTGKRIAENNQRPIGKRLPHQGVMESGELLKRTGGSIVKDSEPAGELHSGNQLFLPEELRRRRTDQFPVTGRTDFPDLVLEVFQKDPVEQTLSAVMKHNIESRSGSMQKFSLP